MEQGIKEPVSITLNVNDSDNEDSKLIKDDHELEIIESESINQIKSKSSGRNDKRASPPPLEHTQFNDLHMETPDMKIILSTPSIGGDMTTNEK